MATFYQKKGPVKLGNINIQARNKSIAFSKMTFKGIHSIMIIKRNTQ